MFQLHHTFKLDAAHQLTQLAEGHPCNHMHGHTWKVRVVVEADSINEETGMLIDFHTIKSACSVIIDAFDHKCLNDECEVLPTCECLARLFYVMLKAELFPVRLAWVEVEETEGNSVRYGE